jgi:hypothetical protein
VSGSGQGAKDRIAEPDKFTGRAGKWSMGERLLRLRSGQAAQAIALRGHFAALQCSKKIYVQRYSSFILKSFQEMGFAIIHSF